ncbi:MAG: penicillin-binding protein [Lachnospiraceae bacterium]|nr:penicillin-binding protein [Lachnospiraceae bacterium]
MFKELIEFIWEKLKQVITSRLFPVVMVFIVLFGLLFHRMYKLQIVGGEEAEKSVQSTTIRTVTTPAVRGRIYDRNGVLLAYNKLTQNVTVTDDGSYANGYERNVMLIRLIRILDEHGETVEQTIPVYCDENGKLQESFASDAARLRFLRDMYGKKSVDELTEEESASHAEEIVSYYTERYGIGRNRDKTTYEIDLPTTVKLIYIRWSMAQNYYVRYRASVVARDVSETTVAAIRENQSRLLGVDIEQANERVYNDAVYFSHIIGYLGLASVEEIDKMNEQGGGYVSGDLIGKAGIESTMEEQLRGTSGSVTMYVNNLGQVQKIIEETDSVAGDDIYLSIDAGLQKATYHLIEQKLAGILVANLRNADVDPTDSEHRVPVKKVYYQLIANNVLDLRRFGDEDAGPAQQRIYEVFAEFRDEALAEAEEELLSDTPTAYNDLTEDMQDCFSALYSVLQDEKILIRGNIDTDAEVYKAYRQDGTISLQEYLREALKRGWVDVAALKLDDKYISSEAVYRQLVVQIMEKLKDSTVFAKAVYEKLIYAGLVMRSDLGLALYEQGVLEEEQLWINRLKLREFVNEDGEPDEEALASDNRRRENAAFAFIKEKINKIQITPAQLAIDPYSAAATVVETATGKVLAMVSYPGYDNNRMDDPAYYASILNDESTPLLNTATQARTTPGSVFKPVTSAAAMETGVMTERTFLTTHGVFSAAGIEVHCWSYPNSHGTINIPLALKYSCNDFFSQVGYRLSLVDGNYVDAVGMEKLREYATLMGLGSKSGVEVAESEPVISDTSAITSAIGHGTHLFTSSHLARYATTIATRGTVYDLTLLDHRNDTTGRLVESYRGEVVSNTVYAETTWDTIHYGMHLVALEGGYEYLFSGKVDFACKTGTARENPNRPNHATFICFAPYNDPEIAVGVTIPHGYTSGNAAELGGYVFDYYYGYLTDEDVFGSEAKDAGGNDITE